MCTATKTGLLTGSLNKQPLATFIDSIDNSNKGYCAT
jgi:hypothetical protein